MENTKTHTTIVSLPSARVFRQLFAATSRAAEPLLARHAAAPAVAQYRHERSVGDALIEAFRVAEVA